MTHLQTTTAFLGLGLAIGILYLLRRDHLYLRDGLFWIGVALSALLLGLWPGLIDRFASLAGVAYPPALLLLVALMVLLLRVLLDNMALAQLRRDLRRVNQRLAMLESEGQAMPPPTPQSSEPDHRLG